MNTCLPSVSLPTRLPTYLPAYLLTFLPTCIPVYITIYPPIYLHTPVPKVAEAVFAYIRLLSEGDMGDEGPNMSDIKGGKGGDKGSSIPDYVFEEIRQLGKISFEYV